MTTQGKYIYGIIKEPKARAFGINGIESAEVYTIAYNDVAAIVSDTALEEIDPTRKNVLAHTTVQDSLLKQYDMLPMGFGMIAASEEDVEKLLEKNYEAFSRELTRLAGKIQVELKVNWDQAAMAEELQGKNEELTKLKAKINAASSEVEKQNLLVQAGQLVSRIAQEWTAKYAQRVYASLKEKAVDAQINKPVGIQNILNASFLIDRSRENEFQEEVYKQDEKYQGKVNFKYVGPLPPYSFVKMKLESASNEKKENKASSR